MLAFAQQSNSTPIDQVIHGDCLSVLATIADNSLDCCITDPPYGLSKEPDAMKWGGVRI